MKRRFFILPVIFLITLLFFNCSVDQTPAKLYAIGDTGPSGVGIVFYITDGGLHGLEAAPSDQSASQVWSNIDATLIGTTGTAIGTGSANTDAIIGQPGHTGSAAQVCRDYTGGGPTDWFLPSQDELNALYLQKAAVGGFANDYYWSSSEGTDSLAWGQFFNDGGQNGTDKSSTAYVRAVRAF